MHEWVKLTTRIGKSVRNPSPGDLESALKELFASGRDDEHPDTWINCGSDDGPLYTMSIFQSGRGDFTKYSDADMSEELEARSFDAPDVASALRAWQALIDGRFDQF